MTEEKKPVGPGVKFVVFMLICVACSLVLSGLKEADRQREQQDTYCAVTPAGMQEPGRCP